jgi:predicted nucleotidyltransferase
MNLSDLREGELKSAFNALEEAFSALDIDFYLIGALARDTWYAELNKRSRATKDVDFAVLIGSQKDYDAVKEYLAEHKNFIAIKNNSFVMKSPDGVEVDILPFGGIEIDQKVQLTGTGLTNIKVNGFLEVYQAGTEEMKMATGHTFKVATLPAIVLLKLIAYDDRPEMRFKDARDIVNIIDHYFDLQAELIYEHHSDIFEGEEMRGGEIAALVIGREMKKIAANNESLHQRLSKIIATQIELKENSAFTRNMVQESGGTVEEAVTLLDRLLQGLTANNAEMY